MTVVVLQVVPRSRRSVTTQAAFLGSPVNLVSRSPRCSRGWMSGTGRQGLQWMFQSYNGHGQRLQKQLLFPLFEGLVGICLDDCSMIFSHNQRWWP